MEQKTIKLLAEIYSFMNEIRARDGVPYTHMGCQMSISQKYWDDMMERIDKTVKEETGTTAWLNPILFGH